MKNKPVKHKSSNTFKFLPFAERISSIDVRHAALYYVDHVNEEKPKENQTYFNAVLIKWGTLNLTKEYKEYRTQFNDIITLPQLIHKKDEIIQVLLEKLQKQQPMYLKPLLEIVVALAKDLREDFYQYFSQIFDILVNLLETKDAEQLEWTFVCLAFLFKILRPFLKKDVTVILKNILPLLSESKADYIVNFAAESFAFVARDIKDKKSFLNLLLKFAKAADNNAIVGCGHLLFEIVKGAKEHFHSCAEEFMNLLLTSLCNDQLPRELLFDIITQIVADILYTIDVKHGDLLWKTLYKSAEVEIDKWKSDETAADVVALEYILRLIGQALEFRQGYFLQDVNPLIQLLIKLSGFKTIPEYIQQIVSKISTLLLLSSKFNLEQEYSARLIRKILSLPNAKVLIDFVLGITSYPQFEIMILPRFLEFTVLSEFSDETLLALSRICLTKAPLTKHGNNLFSWVKYPLDFGPITKKCNDILISHLKFNEIDDVLKDPNKFLIALVCLPHIKIVQETEFFQFLSGIITKFVNLLTKMVKTIDNSDSDTERMLRIVIFLLANAVECSIHLNCWKDPNSVCDFEFIMDCLLPFANNHNLVGVLQLIDLYVTAYDVDHALSYEYVKKIHLAIKDNLSSPFHEMRLYTTHIYSVCEKTISQNLLSNECNESIELFSLTHEVESIRPSIHEYREQITKLQRIAFNTRQFENVRDSEFKLYPIQYMFGALNMNFKLLWSPISELIAGYANGLQTDAFWGIFYPILSQATINSTVNPSVNVVLDDFDEKAIFFSNIYKEYFHVSQKVDFVNYRVLLWRAMEGFAPVCEGRNRDITPLFLKFVEDEFKNAQSQNTLLMNIQKHDKKLNAGNENKVIEEIENHMEIDSSMTIQGKDLFRILLAHLNFFTKIKNPKALYKESMIKEIYLDFLKNQNSIIQKLALDCLMCYKSKNLMPYKENLHNIVDDKKLKEELVSFRIDKENENIVSEHREELISILMRILYGKMISKVHSEKKNGGQMRRSLVLRYLAGCGQDELLIFNKMAFGFLNEYLSLSVSDLQNVISRDFDLKSIFKPKKLQSALNLVEVMRENFGGHMGDKLLPQLLKVVYCCTSMVGMAFVKLDQIHVGYLEITKKLRVQCLKIVTNFFSHFENYEWSETEMLLIHKFLIWPLLKRLPMEGIHSPTALLKLFSTWSQNPRHFALLVAHEPSDISLTPLPYIFKLLLAPKTQSSVTLMIINMLEKMFTLQEKPNSPEWKPFISFNSIPEDDNLIKSLKLQEDLNYGSKILLPYVSDILEILKRRIKSKSKHGGIGRTELLLLSRVTELVSTPETCDSLLDLLLAVLIKKVLTGQSEDATEQSIQTITNLLKKSNEPGKYIKSMASLFSIVTLPNTRKYLISLLKTIAESSTDTETFDTIHSIMNEMNSYDRRWIDQPDFDRRLNAYKNVYQMLEKDKISADLGVLIMHNCFYSINNENDLSLRDSAGQCLRKVAPKLVSKFNDTSFANYVIRETIIQLIIVNIKKSDKEIVKNEAVILLGELARSCSHADVVFRDLAPLCDDNDREVDFFDNMTHLQSHRKIRALLKFCSVMKKVKVTPSTKTLSRIILPLVSEFLCNEKYVAKNSLVDACIDTVAVCSRLLPWHQYEALLKYYLSRLRSSVEYQKQLIRLVIVILDGFHFDFSKAELVSEKINIKTNHELESIEYENQENSDENDDLGNMTSKIIDNPKDGFEPELNIEVNDENEEVEEDVIKSNTIASAFERIIILSPSSAKRTLDTISVGLLIELRESISHLSAHEGSHKINRKKMSYDREQEEIVKVPIALALVKLLQKLPEPMLANNLPGIFTKLCVFLKTPLRQVRIVARNIVKKIMETVGSKYLGILLYHLKLLLTRGYQVHVLVATIHDALETLKAKFQRGDIDEHLPAMLDLCMNDLFGELSEEKKIDKIVGKTPEAKASKKCFVTLNILAQNITEEYVIKLVLPFKELLLKTHSKKTVMKIQDSFHQFVLGLTVNEFIPIDNLLTFLHGLVSETIPDLTPEIKNQDISEAEREKMKRAKSDCFLIPETPKRHREALKTTVRTSSKTNAPILVEFGLSLLHSLLKRERLKGINAKSFLDPMIPILNDALKNSHIKVVISALKCLTSIWISKFSLPQLEKLIKDITKSIFSILHKYAVSGLTKSNDNYQLVHSAFKAVTALVRHVSFHTIDIKQLKALLLYAEQDMQGFERQSTAFTLLKAILDAKLLSPVVHQVMGKVATISVISDAPKTREEARNIFMNYLMNYPLGNKIVKHLQFFTSQLHFEMEYGKESSLKMLEMIVSKFPLESLAEQAGFLFTALGASLVDDLTPSCKELSAKCIESLIERLDIPSRDKLFDLAMVFFSDSKYTHCEMGALLMSRFVSVESANFKDRLRVLLPAILTQIFNLQMKVGGFVRLQFKENEAEENQSKQRDKDHALIQILILCEKICSVCSVVLTGNEFCVEIDDISEYCQNLLAHPHIWVRLKAAKLLSVVLSSPNLELLKKTVEVNGGCDRKFIYCDTGETLKSLVLDLCAQLTPGDVSQEMANEVTNNIMKIVLIVNSIPLFSIPKTQEEKENKCISVLWIINRLRLTINSEMIKSPHSTVIRCSILNTLILIVNLLEIEDLKLVLASIIITLVREMTNTNDSASEVRQLAGRVAKKIRRRLGDMEFNEMVAKAQMNLNAKRVERRKILLQEKVHNPEKAQKRKLHIKEKKVIQKKKKMDVIKGKKPGKRKRAPESDDEF